MTGAGPPKTTQACYTIRLTEYPEAIPLASGSGQIYFKSLDKHRVHPQRSGATYRKLQAHAAQCCWRAFSII